MSQLNIFNEYSNNHRQYNSPSLCHHSFLHASAASVRNIFVGRLI